MKSNSFIAATSLASLVSCMAASSGLAEPIGSAVRIVNKVTGEIDQRQRDLKTSDAVNQNEAIAVAADSLGELKLNDDTKLALGPGARMVLDKFIYDPVPSAGTVSVICPAAPSASSPGCRARAIISCARRRPRSLCAAPSSTSTSTRRAAPGCCCWKALCACVTPPTSAPTLPTHAMSCTSRRPAASMAPRDGRQRRGRSASPPRSRS